MKGKRRKKLAEKVEMNEKTLTIICAFCWETAN